MAQSKLAKATTEATGKKVTDEAIFANALRASGNEDNMPNYHAGDNFAPYGQNFLNNPDTYFDYLNTIAIKYGLVFIKQALAQNPLYSFKRGQIPYGGKIESVVFDTISPKVYRPDLIDGTENPFAQNFGKVVGRTFTQWFDIESSNTIVDTQDTMFFQNLTQFHDFVFGKIAQLVNGAVLDEFYHTKLTLSKSLADDMITKDTADNIKELQKKILYWSRRFQYFSRDNNTMKINQATHVSDIEVIVPLKTSIDIDVDFVANAFNPELFRNTRVHFTEVDALPSVWEYETDHVVTTDDIDKGYLDARTHPIGSTVKAGTIANENATDAKLMLDGDKVGALVLDRDALQLWDALPLTLSTINNPKKRYTNIFLNQKTALMFVQSLNSKAIMLG